MNKEDHVSDYADEGCIIKQFKNEGIHVSIYQWAETATELSPDNRNEINSVRQIYLEIDEEEYQDWQILRFVSILLGSLPSEDNKRMLISLQAVVCKNKTT